MARFVAVLLLASALATAGCDDKGYTVTGPDPTPRVGPLGPAAMTMYMVKQTDVRWTLRLGGIINLGLISQPTQADDSLAMVIVHSYACGARRDYVVGINNSQWTLNADTTLIRDIDACDGRVEFELEIETFYRQRIYHKLDDPRPIFLDIRGFAVPIEVRRGSDGRGRLVARLQ